MSYQPGDPGDWGSMQEGPGISIASEELIGEMGASISCAVGKRKVPIRAQAAVMRAKYDGLAFHIPALT